MIIDEKDYLAHVGVKGMKWGIRKQNYKLHRLKRNRQGKLTGRQRVGAVVGGFGLGSLASFVTSIATKNLTLSSLVTLPSSVAGGLYIRNQMLEKHGTKRLSEIR